MSKGEPSSLACLDANIFLAVLIPEATRAPKDEIAGAGRGFKAVEAGRLRGISTAILFGEIRYAYLREDKPGFEEKSPVLQSRPRPTCAYQLSPCHWLFRRC